MVGAEILPDVREEAPDHLVALVVVISAAAMATFGLLVG